MKEHIKEGLFFAIAYLVLEWIAIGLVGSYLYKNGLWSNWFFLIIPLLGITVFRLRKKPQPSVAFRKFFKKAIDEHFADDAPAVLSEVDRRYKILSVDTAFAAKSSNPIDRRLDFSACFLALIQTLEERNQSYDQIKNICLEITYEYVSPKNSLQKWLKQVPGHLVGLKLTSPFIRLLNRKVSIKGNSEGFRAAIITDKAQTYNFGYGILVIRTFGFSFDNKNTIRFLQSRLAFMLTIFFFIFGIFINSIT